MLLGIAVFRTFDVGRDDVCNPRVLARWIQDATGRTILLGGRVDKRRAWSGARPGEQGVRQGECLTTVGLTGKQTAPCGLDGAHKMWVLVYKASMGSICRDTR